ncbi:MAG TPA: GFA family protein [Rhizomicrobium sp.]|nr:GFA family protein [Rhizomicrobium sp.]
MKIEGACHCGAIAWEAEVEPGAASICHCSDCQSLSGAPFRASVPAKAEDFRILKGTPKTYVKVADSGNRRAQGFCADCGSPIYSTTVGDARVYNLRLGAVKQRAQIPPRKQIWGQSALAWAQDVSALPMSAKG